MQNKNSIIRHIPNFLTCMNLLSGSIAIIIVFENPANLIHSCWLIGVAAIFDFLDGMTARALKAYSDVGKELDSIADMVSFGLTPAIIMYHLLKQTICINHPNCGLETMNMMEIIILFSSLTIAVFSAIRLAKFNVDTRQTDAFIGLATPANAMLIASLPVILYFNPETDNIFHDLILNQYFLIPLTLFLSFMLVAEFPMFSLKFKNLKFDQNKIRYIFIGVSIILAISLQSIAIPLIILFYILLSAINTWVLKG